MTFAEVSAVVGKPLPPRAYSHPAWWATPPSMLTRSGWTSAIAHART
ncbi:DUF7662 domain-containing protein [Actinomadura litoris]